MQRAAKDDGRRPAARSCVRLQLDSAQDPSDLAEKIDQIEETAVEMAAAGGLPREDAHFLGIALREAVVNALRHGRRVDGRCDVVVRLRSLLGHLLLMCVRDLGPGFDPASVGDPCLPENLPKGSGRGIFYMRRFVDRVRFSFPRDGGAVVGLMKRLPGGRPRED
ncbi:MAG: ATP-binding protein [Vicinamibacteria bacterium]